MTAADQTSRLLEVRDLKVDFHTDAGIFHAVDGVSFTLDRGRTLGVVGESGCGKSVTSMAIMRLLARPQARIANGQILFDGQDLNTLPESEMRKVRGQRIGMVFQEPMTSLNPVYTIAEQIGEALRAHGMTDRGLIRERIIAMLRAVGLPSPDKRADDYPHQLSGGQRQRVMIALALINEPELLIADEPTTALDVTIQAQILQLMRDLCRNSGSAMMLITHDLGVVAETCDEVVVMYAGEVVEKASVEALFGDAQHPYTLGLMAAVPRIDTDAERLATIPGMVPPPYVTIQGCKFASRCAIATDECRASRPPLREIAPGHMVKCWRAPIEELNP